MRVFQEETERQLEREAAFRSWTEKKKETGVFKEKTREERRKQKLEKEEEEKRKEKLRDAEIVSVSSMLFITMGGISNGLQI